MGIILKKAIHDFKKLGWHSYLIVFTIIFTLGGGLGMYYGISAALPFLNIYFDDVNHADYVYTLSEDTAITQEQLDGLDDLDRVKDYTGRLIWSTSLELPGQDKRKYVLLVGLDYDDSKLERPKVYDYNIKTGENFDPDENKKSILIDKTFADKNNLKVGDKLKIDGLNNAEVKIYGLVNAPEFVALTSNPEYLFPSEGSMVVMYIYKETLKDYIVQYFISYNLTTPEDLTPQILFYQSVDYNSLAITFKGDPDKGHKEVRNYLDDLNVNIDKAEAFEDSYVYDQMKSDVKDTGEVMIILLYFMAFLGGIIVYVIFNRYVYSQKQQIGILLGLGYTKRDIIRYFIFSIFIISILSIPAGIAVGYGFGFLMVNVLISELANVEIFTLPFLFIPDIIYIGLVLGILIVFLSTLFPIRKINKKIIAELIYEQEEVRYKTKKSKETKKPRYISSKLVFRNLFQNKKRMLFTMIAMTFSLLIVASSENLLDTMYFNVDKTFKSQNNDIQANEVWDLNVNFQISVNYSESDNLVDQIEDIDDVKCVEIYVKSLVIAKGEKNLNVLLLGIDIKDSDVHHFSWHQDASGSTAPNKDSEIVISSVHALKLGKWLGDDLKIVSPDGETEEYKIVGIHSELVMILYITFDAAQDFLNTTTERVDGLYIILDEDADREKITDKIYDLGNIEAVFDIYDMNEDAMEFINNYASVVQVIAFYTLGLSFFIVLYNSIMNIFDKNYEYGILRSLGYPKRRVFKMILIENFLQGLFPIILALIFTYPLTVEMNKAYDENFPMQAIVGLPAILMITISPLILYVLGSFIGLRTIYKQNLFEQVQTRYVG